MHVPVRHSNVVIKLVVWHKTSSTRSSKILWEDPVLLVELVELTPPHSKCRWLEVPACFIILTIEWGLHYQTREYSTELALQLSLVRQILIRGCVVISAKSSVYQTISFTLQYLRLWTSVCRISDSKIFPIIFIKPFEPPSSSKISFLHVFNETDACWWEHSWLLTDIWTLF